MNGRIALLLAVTCLAEVAVAAQTPSASDLLECIPSLTSIGNEAHPFAVRARINHDDTPVEVNVCWQEDGKYSVLLYDESSHTPIACFSQNGFAIYNAIKRSVTFGPELKLEYRLFATSSSIKFDWNFSRPDAEQVKPVALEFDLKSFAILDALKVEKTDDGKCFELTCLSSSGKSYSKWEFEAIPEIRFKKFAQIWSADNSVMIEVELLHTGKSVSTSMAPRSISKEGDIRAIHWKPNGVLAFAELFAEFFESIAAQAALTDPQYRQRISFSHVSDWDAVVDQCEADRDTVLDLFNVKPAR